MHTQINDMLSELILIRIKFTIALEHGWITKAEFMHAYRESIAIRGELSLIFNK